MALRDFIDRGGRQWRVWEITRDELHPSARGEEYLHGFLEGWLVFEASDGHEKRRLRPVPPNWIEATDAELERLLRSAEPARAGSSSVRGAPEGSRDRAPDADRPVGAPNAESRQSPVTIRSFRYPGGRYWSAHERRVLTRDDSGEPREEQIVLRFAAGARVLDLRAWPREWVNYSDEQLAELLYTSFPRQPESPNPTPHHRRRGERLESGPSPRTEGS